VLQFGSLSEFVLEVCPAYTDKSAYNDDATGWW